MKTFPFLFLPILFHLSCVSEDISKNPQDCKDCSTPILSLSTTEIRFDDFEKGMAEEMEFILSNTGTQDLRIDAIGLIEGIESDDIEEFKKGKDWPSDPIALAKGEELNLTLLYLPENSNIDLGKITIKSNDPEQPLVEILLSTSPTLGPLLSSLDTIDFHTVSPPSEESKNQIWELNLLENIGSSALNISNISVVGGNGVFSLSFPTSTDVGVDPKTDQTILPKSKLEPGEEVAVRVYFNPEDDSPVEAELNIESDSIGDAIFVTKLIGNSDPCLELSDDILDFREVNIAIPRRSQFQVKNCGRVDLSIESIDLCTDVDDTCDENSNIFSWGNDEIQNEARNGFTLREGETKEVEILFSPIQVESFSGELTIKSNTFQAPVSKVLLQGKGTNKLCPTAVALVREMGNPFQTSLAVDPLTTIELSGSQSTDPDGSVERFDWSIIAQPAGSTVNLSDESAENPTLFLDRSGDYIVELRVFDDKGTESCEPSTIKITANFPKGIHFELTWDTPGDPDQSDDNGTDLDLHLLHPNGRWNRAPWDIFFNNKTAEWGKPGPEDDPSMVLDDVNGSGPETIQFNPDMMSLRYSVGVFYYADRQFGASNATLTVFIDGVKIAETSRMLTSTNTFWYVGLLDWPSHQFIEIDQVQDGFP